MKNVCLVAVAALSFASCKEEAEAQPVLMRCPPTSGADVYNGAYRRYRDTQTGETFYGRPDHYADRGQGLTCARTHK